MEKKVESVGDLLVETIQLRETLLLKMFICREGSEQASSEWGVNPLKQFQKNQADAIAVGQEAVAPGVRNLFNQALGPQLGQVVAQRGEAIVIGGATQGLGGLGMQFCRGEGTFGGDMGKAQQGMHKS